MPELETTVTETVETPTPTAETPAAPPVVEPSPEATVETPETPHPLEPGGKRFDQVWSRAKTAEAKLQEEREQRIRLEERLKAAEERQVEATAKAEPAPHTWETLEGWITEGRITRAQANEYREGIVRKEAAKDAEARLQKQTETTQRAQSVDASLKQYRDALPTLNDRGSPERVHAEREYAFLVQLHGSPKDAAQQLAYELSACRAAFGDPTNLSKLRASAEAAQRNRETFVETQSSGRPTPQTDNDTVPPEVAKDANLLEHYQRMMKHGRYPGGWKEVREELAYKVPGR